MFVIFKSSSWRDERQSSLCQCNSVHGVRGGGSISDRCLSWPFDRISHSWRLSMYTCYLWLLSLLKLNQCCCPREKSVSSRILKDQFLSPCPCPWTTKSSKVVENYTFCKQCYVWSRDIHKFGYRHRAWGYGEEWLTYWSVNECCCPRGKSLSSRILVFVLEH